MIFTKITETKPMIDTKMKNISIFACFLMK